DLQFPFHFAVNGESPGVRVFRGCWHESIVADEEMLCWRDVGIEQMRQRLEVDWPVVHDDQPFLALQDELIARLGKGCGNDAGRHVARKGDGRAKSRTHGRQTGAAEETPAVRFWNPAE